MNIEKIGLLLFAGLIAFAETGAQATAVLYNVGDNLTVTTGSLLYINGALENVTGLLSNAGNITVNGYFRNNGIADGGGGTNGLYNVAGDWINNNTFNAGQSEVALTGGAQNITGTQTTSFYNLTVNTPGSVKTLGIDIRVENVDSLNSCEEATSNFNLFVMNPDTGAIKRTNGFISSTGAGRLSRTTNSTGNYLFPTGWNNNGNVLYRPIEISPSTSDNQSFTVRFADENPADDGYNISTKATGVALVNNQYYHLVRQYGSTSPADLIIYFDPNTDGQWNSIARWQGAPQWTDLAPVFTVNSAPLYSVTKAGWIDDGNEPHALITSEIVVPQVFIPNAFSPIGDGNNDYLRIYGNKEAWKFFEVEIFDRWGEKVFASNDMNFEWDGNYKGRPMASSVFTYAVRIAVDKDQTGQLFKGSVTMVR